MKLPVDLYITYDIYMHWHVLLLSWISLIDAQKLLHNITGLHPKVTIMLTNSLYGNGIFNPIHLAHRKHTDTFEIWTFLHMFTQIKTLIAIQCIAFHLRWNCMRIFLHNMYCINGNIPSREIVNYVNEWNMLQTDEKKNEVK